MFKKLGEWMDDSQNSSNFLIICGIIIGGLLVSLAAQIDLIGILRDMESALRQ